MVLSCRTEICWKCKFCYKDTDNFIVHVKTEDIYEDIAEDIEKSFDTSEFELIRPLPTGKNRKLIGLMKDKLLSGQIIKEWKTKTYSYLKDNNYEDKNAKSTKKCVIKRKRTIQYFQNCLEAAQIENEINHSEKNKIDVDSFNQDQ